MTFAALFVSMITVAGANTIVSKIEVRDRTVYMIINFQMVELGVNGDVSKFKIAISTVVALLVAVLRWFILTKFLDWLLLIPFVIGVVGNLLDNVFGTVLKNPGYILEYTNNCFMALISRLLRVHRILSLFTRFKVKI